MNIEKYIEERLNPQIEWYNKKSAASQKFYKTFQVTQIILASLIPLLAGYSDHHWCVSLTAGLFGAAIAILEAISKLNKFHENWIIYQYACELLEYQKYLYLNKAVPYHKEPAENDSLFVSNVEKIIYSENRHWKAINSLADGNITHS